VIGSHYNGGPFFGDATPTEFLNRTIREAKDYHVLLAHILRG
jgi:hypothetical protein